MNNGEYWAKRAEVREAISYTNGLEAIAALKREYEKAAASIRKDINDYYQRFADENGISYADAVKYMSRPEAREWQDTVEGYLTEIQNCKDPVMQERLMQEYDARAYNSRITRYDALIGGIEMDTNRLFVKANERFRELLGDTYEDGYYRTMYDIGTRLGYSGDFARINADIIENTLTYPWSGANFSDRLWKNKTALVDTVRETLTQGMIRGDSIKNMSKAIADKLGQSYSNAERLVRTETSHIHNTAEIDAYTAACFEEYEFRASIGERTCKTCGDMEGKRFKISERKNGVNFPPLHPNCRCTTVGIDPFDEDEPLLEEGEQEELTFEEWTQKYLEEQEQALTTEMQQKYPDGNQTKLLNEGGKAVDKFAGSGIIKENGLLSEFVDAKTSDEAKFYAHEVLGLKEHEYDHFNLDLANMVNREIARAYDVFGDIAASGLLDGVDVLLGKEDWNAGYNRRTHILLLKDVSSDDVLEKMSENAQLQFNGGAWSTSVVEHSIRHELGHAIGYMLADNEHSKQISQIRTNIMEQVGISEWKRESSAEIIKKAGEYISYYALASDNEMISESIAEYLAGNPRRVAKAVVDILLGR